MSLQILTPPSAEPVTVDEVKAVLRMSVTNTADDAMIAGNIVAAREQAEKVTRRSLASKSYLLSLDKFPSPGERFILPVPPLVSVESIKYLDSSLTQQTWDPAEYFLALNQTPGVIVPKPGQIYPCAVLVPGAVEVRFTAGQYDRESVRQAIRQIAAFYYDHPELVTSTRENDTELPHNAMSVLRANRVY
jgi:uncharacterized phiE125 gp8 family phage protein